MSRKKIEPDLEFITRINEITRVAGGQSALSKISGIPQSTLAAYYKGGEPTRPQLIALAKATEKTISWLVTGEDPMSTHEGQPTTKVLQIQPQEPKDLFDQVMDEFYNMVKNWQAEENDRTIKTTIEFTQEFTLRFPEMRDWLKKRGGGGDTGRLQQQVRNIV